MTKIPEQIREKFIETLYDEVKFGIINAIDFYESVNLKRLAVLVGRPETTTIRYIKKLLAEELITIDAEKTAKEWGKFYKLSEPVQLLFDERRKQNTERENWIHDEIGDLEKKSEQEVEDFMVKAVLSKENIELEFHLAKQVLAFSTNTQKMIINDSISVVKELLQIYNEKGQDYLEENLILDPSDIELWSSSIKLHSMKQLMELINVFNKWQKEMIVLKKKFEKEMNENSVPEDQRRDFFMYSFLGSLDFSYTLKDKK
ncbi:MAG: hypothetical protein ACTSXA_04855 [Candidatus Heimdallarchaeota archaeon]